MIKNDQLDVGQPRFTKHKIGARSLTGLGIGGIIGGGFFLGSGLAVHEAGPSVAVAFLLGGLVMMQVLGSMTSINVNRLAPGSFRVYAEQMLGPYVGFLMGWVSFSSSILALGSEALAMGIFVRFWLKMVPLPILASLFTAAVIWINSLGMRNLGRIETAMAFIKIAVLVAFIVVGGYGLVTHSGIAVIPNPFSGIPAVLPNGIAGLLQSMLVVIFCYTGISAVAMAASEARNPPTDIPRASLWTAVGVIAVYTLAMVVLVLIVPWSSVYTDQSPFVQALSGYGFAWFATLLNAVILVAASSVMIATYYATIRMLVSLAEAHKAPAILRQVNERGLYFPAWMAVGVASLAIVALSYFVPPQLFNYLVAASSYFIFLNWTLSLTTYLVWRKRKGPQETYLSPLIWGRPGAYGTIAAIALLFVMSLRVEEFRPGFYAAFVIIVAISIAYLFWMRAQSNRTNTKQP